MGRQVEAINLEVHVGDGRPIPSWFADEPQPQVQPGGGGVSTVHAQHECHEPLALGARQAFAHECFAGACWPAPRGTSGPLATEGGLHYIGGMRELFENLIAEPRNPMEAARKAMQAALHRRFYREAAVGEAGPDGFPVLLDGRAVRTPARRSLAAPTEALAGAIAAEWDAQQGHIDPTRMPLNRQNWPPAPSFA